MCISGAPASGTNFHVRFYPDVRLTAQIYKKILAGSPADGSQRVKTKFLIKIKAKFLTKLYHELFSYFRW